MKKFVWGIVGSITLVGLVFGVLYVVASRVLPTEQSVYAVGSAGALLGKKAPYFDLPNLSGDRVHLLDESRQPTIIFFWATWNPVSRDQLKIFDDYVKTGVGHAVVRIIGINSQEDRSVALSYVRRGGYHVPIALDSSGMTTEQYGVKGLPTTLLVDRDGVVRDIVTGALSASDIVDKIEKIVQ